jgi:hypothetical protein
VKSKQVGKLDGVKKSGRIKLQRGRGGGEELKSEEESSQGPKKKKKPQAQKQKP